MNTVSLLAVAGAFLAGSVATTRAAEKARTTYTRNVAIVVWEGAEVLDWAGPSEVFESAGGIGQNGDERAFNVYTVSKTTDPIVSQRFVKVVPEYSIADVPRPDIIVLPGGGVGSVRKDPEFLAWISEAATEAEVALSVCTGAFILGDAGLLDGQSATTWYGALDGFEKTFPDTRLVRGPRYVDNGHVVTTAGVSAGIDGALHVVARLLGRHVADRTAQYMEYKWSPESYLSKNYSVLNPSLDNRGRTMQQAAFDRDAGDGESAIDTYKALLKADPKDAAVWSELGATCYGAERWKESAEAYVRSAALLPSLRRNAYYNAACSYARAGEKARALECLEKAVDEGFSDDRWLAADDDFTSLHDDPRFKRLVERLQETANAKAGG